MIRQIENKNSYNANQVSFKSKRIMTSTFKGFDTETETYLCDMFARIDSKLNELSKGAHIVVRGNDDNELLFTATEKQSKIPFMGWMFEIKEALNLAKIDTNLSINKLLKGKEIQKGTRNLGELSINQVNEHNVLTLFDRIAKGTRALVAETKTNGQPRDYVKIIDDFNNTGL